MSAPTIDAVVSAAPLLASAGAEAAKELGYKIARRRTERGMNQQRLADLAEMSKGQLQVIERGWSDRAKRTPANPRLSSLISLCRELGGTVRIDVAYPVGFDITFDDDM